MAGKKKKAAKPKPAPVVPYPEPQWWERLTTRVSSMGSREWTGLGVFCGLVVIVLVLYLTY